MQITKDEKNRKKVLTKGNWSDIIIKLSHERQEREVQKTLRERSKNIIQKQFKNNLLQVNWQTVWDDV